MDETSGASTGHSGKKSSQKSISKKIVHKTLQAALVFHAFTQANYCVQGNQDSAQRTEFEKEFGFPVQGFPRNVEGTEGNLSKIAAAVEKERLERPFGLTSIRVSSDNYLQKSIFGQLEYIIIKGGEAYDGINYPFMGRIYLSDGFAASTVNHEIKHAKTDDIICSNPEFEEKWKALATDKDGNSLYSGYSGLVFSRVRLIGDFIDHDAPSITENEALGFTTVYSRVHFYEDIAVLSEEAERDYLVDQFIKYLYEQKNEKFVAKINLLQEYGLIPAEFTEYIGIRQKIKNNQKDDRPLEEIFEISDTFLDRHKDSVYEIVLRKIRGDALNLGARGEEAIFEYKLGLTSIYKDNEFYPAILGNVSHCYAGLRNKEMAAVYEKAKEKYDAGWKGNDVKIAVHGVNDFLQENGEKF